MFDNTFKYEKRRGIIEYKGIFRRFKILLDRTADSSEALLKEVDNSIVKFIKNMKCKESEYEYLQVYSQKQDDFDTSFEYYLIKEIASLWKLPKMGLMI